MVNKLITGFNFESKYIEFEGNKYHYLDEGEGETIIFIHGTPDWSYSWRYIIDDLSKTNRCIALDNLGFGHSDKPVKAGYTIKEQAIRLNSIIKKLKLNNFHLVVHDFGGPIGIYSAIDTELNCKSISIMNTWLWDLSDDKNFSASKFFHNALGKFLYLNMGFAINVMMKNAYYDSKLANKQQLKPYSDIFNSKEKRTATYTYAKELLNSSDFTKSLLTKLKTSNIKKQLIWGMNDKFFKPYIMEKFKSEMNFNNITEIKNCGHFPQEEQPEQVAMAVREFVV